MAGAALRGEGDTAPFGRAVRSRPRAAREGLWALRAVLERAPGGEGSGDPQGWGVRPPCLGEWDRQGLKDGSVHGRCGLLCFVLLVFRCSLHCMKLFLNLFAYF